MDLSTTCRFCLTKSQILNETTQEIVNVFHDCLGIQLKGIEGTKVCKQCTTFINEICDFKLMCIESETQLGNLLIEIKEEPKDVNTVEPAEEIFCELVAVEEKQVEDALTNCKEQLEEDNSKQEDDDFEWDEPLGVSDNNSEPVPMKVLKKTKLRKVKSKKQELQKCSLCGKEVRGLARHMKSHNAIIERPSNYAECDICHKTFRMNSIKAHMKIHENDPCPICDRQLSKTAMPLHILRHKKPDEITQEEKEKYRKYFCAMCCSFSLSLENHQRVVHGPPELVSCDVCGETMRREKLNVHIQWTHNGPFICDICSREFKNKIYVRSHIEQFHLKIKNVFCSFCSKGFYNITALTSHIKRHHQSPEFVCSECGKGFAYKKALNTHIEAVHVKSGNVKCQHCGAKYNSKSALQYHVSTAHNATADAAERRYGEFHGKCVCGEEFFSRASFTQHLHADHKKEDGRFHCPCGRDYISKPKLTVHFERYHKVSCMYHKKKPAK